VRNFNSAISGIDIENVNSPSEAPQISVFPKDKTNWRIDWFGDIAFPNRLVRRKQPSVLVHLSRITDNRFLSDPSALLSPQCTRPAQFQKRVWVSVGSLTLLRIGDIWRDGQLVLRPDYELEKFHNVQISKNSTSLVKAGLNLDEGGFLLPLSEHPWHLQCTMSYCLMVQLPEYRRMIIPCLELVRFYFGSSSNLLSKLFLPPLKRESLFSSAILDPKTRKLQIDLAERMSGASAADIGRISMDPVAAHAARIIGASCLRASTAGQLIYPQAIFPFEGTTDLIASGTWLSHGNAPRSTFLVYSLRSCSHPFPFRSLQYTTLGRSSEPNSSATDAPTHASTTANRRAAPNSKDQSLVERDASNHLSRKTNYFKEAPRFPDLDKKYIWRNKMSFTETSDEAPLGSAGQSVVSAAVGDAGSDQRVRPVDLAVITSVANWNLNSVPPFLRSTVATLHQLATASIELRTRSQDDGWTVPVSVLADMDGEIEPKLMIATLDGKLRMRRAAIFLLKRETMCLHIVTIESEPPHIKIHITTAQDKDNVWATLRFAAIDLIKGIQSDNLESALANSFTKPLDR
jgi:hypothetical protein